MKTVSLSGSPRANVGKKDAKAERRAGRVPCVLYGGEKQYHFTVKQIEAQKLVYTPEVYRVNVKVDGNDFSAIVQEAQQHPVTDKVMHLDFLQLFDDKEVTVSLPVRITGASVGVRNGGKLSQTFRKLAMRGLPSAFPEAIELDISDLKIGQSIRVNEIKKDGIRFLDPEGAVVVGVKTARKAIVEVGDEEEGEAAEGAEAPAEGGGDAPAAEGGE